MNVKRGKPLVGIIADSRVIGPHPYHLVGDKYVRAVEQCADVFPVLIPAFAGSMPVAEIVARFDGVVLSGSYSNIQPHHYGARQQKDPDLHDPHRDATTLPLIPALIDAGVPLLGICRGFQEMNVAFGGRLHQEVHKVDGLQDHRENNDAPLEVQYGPSHPVRLNRDGLLYEWLQRDGIEVNSLHGQGIDQLGQGLQMEAEAPDGLIEAFSVRGARRFALAVQWHPEWRATENPVSQKLFEQFGKACRDRQELRTP